jgi:hypothetical protein
MTDSRNKSVCFERKFARALDAEIAESRNRDFRTVARRLQNLERSYLVALPGNSAAALEIRRRIAEQMFEQALSHNCSRMVCRVRLAKLSKLGFTNLERKAHFYLLEGRALLSQGSSRLARSTAKAMIRELEGAPRRSRNRLRKELLRLTKTLLRDAEQDEENS